MLKVTRWLFGGIAILLAAPPVLAAQDYAPIGGQVSAEAAAPLDLFQSAAPARLVSGTPTPRIREVLVAGPARPVGRAPAVRLSELLAAPTLVGG